MVETAPLLPLVFFPGAGGRKEFLEPLRQLLAPRRETLLCGYPGLSGEPADPALHSLTDLRGYLLARLPPKFDLVTMSMGGVLALQIALHHPERLRKLVLMATSGGIDIASLGALDWREQFRKVQPNAPSWFLDDRSDVTAHLHTITHPTLLIYGDADLIAPAAAGQLLARHLPNAHLEVIPGATHDLEIDHPHTIAALIEAHLRKP